ncbi:MAG: hypothetical protein FWG25_11010, partial [Promicromonosporaceae bacterium]|nr:hypothetical protein [Promicromonosporaceae bacterium]
MRITITVEPVTDRVGAVSAYAIPAPDCVPWCEAGPHDWVASGDVTEKICRAGEFQRYATIDGGKVYLFASEWRPSNPDTERKIPGESL